MGGVAGGREGGNESYIKKKGKTRGVCTVKNAEYKLFSTTTPYHVSLHEACSGIKFGLLLTTTQQTNSREARKIPFTAISRRLKESQK